VASDREERNRVFGVPVPSGARDRPDEEPQRVLGFPVSWFGPVDHDVLRVLTRPIRGYQRWRQRRDPGAS
jgi:hypothetical protein